MGQSNGLVGKVCGVLDINPYGKSYKMMNIRIIVEICIDCDLPAPCTLCD
jgi:hypothetical protein